MGERRAEDWRQAGRRPKLAKADAQLGIAEGAAVVRVQRLEGERVGQWGVALTEG